MIVWSKLMSLTLSLNLQSELWRWDLLVKLNVTAERIEQLKPPYDIRCARVCVCALVFLPVFVAPLRR